MSADNRTAEGTAASPLHRVVATLVLTTLALLAAVLGSRAASTATASAAPAKAASSAVDCTAGARLVSANYVVSKTNPDANLASIQLRYSPVCGGYYAQVFPRVHWSGYWFSAEVVSGDLKSRLQCHLTNPGGTDNGCTTAVISRVPGRGYRAEGLMFKDTYKNIVAFGETPFMTSIGITPVTIAQAIENGAKEPGWGGGKIYYGWGDGHGSTPGPTSSKLDCSGFTRWVYYLAYGKDILTATNASGQRAHLTKVTTPIAGDLVYFREGNDVHHVGVYVGNGRMIDAPRPGRVVSNDPVSYGAPIDGYYRYIK